MTNKNMLLKDQKKKNSDSQFQPSSLFPEVVLDGALKPETKPIIPEITKGHRSRPGYQELVHFNVFETSVVSYLDEILSSDDFNIIRNNIKKITSLINGSLELDNALVMNPTARSKFTETFGKLLRMGDFVDIGQFFKPPISDLINKYSKEINLKDCAIDYLLKYITLFSNINKKNISFYCKHILDILKYFEINSNFPRFKELQLAVEHIELCEVYDPKIANLLKRFFDRIFKKKKENIDQLTIEQPEWNKNAATDPAVLINIADKYINGKSSFHDHAILKDIAQCLLEHSASFSSYMKNNVITYQITKFFMIFLNNKDTLNVETILSQPLVDLIDFKSKNGDLKVFLNSYLKGILMSEGQQNRYKKLNNSNIDKFLKHISEILAILELINGSTEDYDKFKLIFKARIAFEKKTVKENSNKVPKELELFLKEYFHKTIRKNTNG